jgi:hypothetical protein
MNERKILEQAAYAAGRELVNAEAKTGQPHKVSVVVTPSGELSVTVIQVVLNE